jgi:hypothetical protein
MYYVKQENLKNLMNQNKNKIKLSMFLTHFSLVKKIYDMCFDNLINFKHQIITILHKPYDINPFIPLLKHPLKDGYLFLKKKKNLNI